jgi:hypothetical protein
MAVALQSLYCSWKIQHNKVDFLYLQHGDLNKQNASDKKALEEKEQIIKVCLKKKTADLFLMVFNNLTMHPQCLK